MGLGRHRRTHGAPVGDAAAVAGLTLDPWQQAAAGALDRLAADLGVRRRHRNTCPGVYLWGPVGRGKTWLLDAFFDAAPLESKARVHFHSFFRDLHAAVRRNRSAAHAFDAAVSDLLTGRDLLCFDELHFHDVGDAMLVSRLLQRAFERGITLVTTSNYPPAGLLPHPLFHHLAEPAIDLIHGHMEVIELAGPTDYRARARAALPARGFGTGTMVWPGTDHQLAQRGLRPPGADEATRLDVGTRTVPALRAEGRVVWFDFAQLCEGPTSSLDLLTLADRFSTWVVSSVPRLAARPADAQQRFVNLVDVLHDRDIRLLLIAEAHLDALLEGPLCVPDTERTYSRLQIIAGRRQLSPLVPDPLPATGGFDCQNR